MVAVQAHICTINKHIWMTLQTYGWTPNNKICVPSAKFNASLIGTTLGDKDCTMLFGYNPTRWHMGLWISGGISTQTINKIHPILVDVILVCSLWL